MTPDERAAVRALHTRLAGSEIGLNGKRVEVEFCGNYDSNGEWPCPTIRLLDALDRVTAERDELREAFVRHRTATHEVKPTFCVTCRESDAALALVSGGTDGEGR